MNLEIQRIILGDSAFASLKTCHAMKENNLQFIGSVKTSNTGYCKAYFQNLHLNNRGDHYL